MSISSQITELETESEYYQFNNNIPEVIGIQERILILQAQSLGTQSHPFKQTTKLLAELCNLQALRELEEERHATCLELLKKAELLSESHKLVQAITFNNFGCYYKKYVN